MADPDADGRPGSVGGGIALAVLTSVVVAAVLVVLGLGLLGTTGL